jgi:hypothetical protein
MRSNEEMASLARLFYDAYIEEVVDAEKDPATIQAQFHGVAAAGAAFMGALLGDFYNEHPTQNHVFFAAIAMKQLTLTSVGFFPGLYTREEMIRAFNLVGEQLSRSPQMLRKDGL